ncbi:hypothetical protein H4582DRAFT_1978661 [Lactarius indigo]|nr:hypothetical protein H4582DRAFT_1978661 [Lactarius indigo]
MTSDIVAVMLWCFFHLSASPDGSDPERTCSTTFAMILDVRLAHCAVHPISSCLRSSRGWRLHRPSWVRGCTYVSEVSRTLI